MMNMMRDPAWIRYARVAVLLSGGPFAALAIVAILPALAQMAAHFSEGGADGAFLAQNVLTVTAPTMAFGAPLIGWLAERIGIRRAFLGSALIYAVAGAGGAFAPDVWTMMAARLLLGLATAGIMTISATLIGEYYIGAPRERMLGWISVVGSGGAVLGLNAAGALAKIGGWQAPFALYLVGIVVFLLALPTIAGKHYRSEATEVARTHSVRASLPMFTLIVALSVVLFMVTIQSPLALAEKGFTDPDAQALIITMTIIGGVTAGLVFGWLRARLGFQTMLAVVWACFGIGITGLGATHNFIALAAFSGLAGFPGGLIQPLTQSELLRRVASTASARIIGIATGCIFLGQLLNPFLLKPLRMNFGIENAFIYVGLTSLAAAALTLIWRMKDGLRRAPQVQ